MKMKMTSTNLPDTDYWKMKMKMTSTKEVDKIVFSSVM